MALSHALPKNVVLYRIPGFVPLRTKSLCDEMFRLGLSPRTVELHSELCNPGPVPRGVGAVLYQVSQ